MLTFLLRSLQNLHQKTRIIKDGIDSKNGKPKIDPSIHPQIKPLVTPMPWIKLGKARHFRDLPQFWSNIDLG